MYELVNSVYGMNAGIDAHSVPATSGTILQLGPISG